MVIFKEINEDDHVRVEFTQNSIVSVEATYLNLLKKSNILSKYGENSSFARNIVRVLTREI
jgi:hypothetical protein